MILLFISFIAGILTVLAPCVLPLLPVIVGGSLSGGTSVRRALTVTISLAVSVIAFTLLIKASTVLIGVPQDFWKWFSGLIIIGFGFITVFPSAWDRIPILARLSVSSNKVLASGYKKHSFAGDVIVGASLGPVFSTCSPTYFLVLAAVLPQNVFLGFIYLLAYSIGLSLALLAIAFVGQKIIGKVGIAADSRGVFKKIIGILFLVVGVAIITGYDKRLQTEILDAGFFDITKVEQKLLELVPASGPELSPQGDVGGVQNNTGEQNGQENPSQKPAQATSPQLSQQSQQSAVQLLSAAEKAKRYPRAPEISSPDGFVNTDGQPITLESLRGKVVLLDIWTYSCINCQRTLPYISTWYDKYKDQGFVVVGLHTPEFAFERVLKNVEKATRDFGIKYPVVLDNDYSTWNAYGNKYWPRKYLIDIDGYIVYDHIGEGDYDVTERAIQKALAERSARLNVPATIPTSISTPTNTSQSSAGAVGSPEVYFGAWRNNLLANGTVGATGSLVFTLPSQPKLNLLYLGGRWNIASEYAQSETDASTVFVYSAKNVYMVAGSDQGAEIEVYKDNVLTKTITVKDETLYPLIEGTDYGQHTLRIEVKSGNLKAFTFTFG